MHIRFTGPTLPPPQNPSSKASSDGVLSAKQLYDMHFPALPNNVPTDPFTPEKINLIEQKIAAQKVDVMTGYRRIIKIMTEKIQETLDKARLEVLPKKQAQLKTFAAKGEKTLRAYQQLLQAEMRIQQAKKDYNSAITKRENAQDALAFNVDKHDPDQLKTNYQSAQESCKNAKRALLEAKSALVLIPYQTGIKPFSG